MGATGEPIRAVVGEIWRGDTVTGPTRSAPDFGWWGLVFGWFVGWWHIFVRHVLRRFDLLGCPADLPVAPSAVAAIILEGQPAAREGHLKGAPCSSPAARGAELT